MKRDMELIRKLLFFFDERETEKHIKIPPIEGYDDQAIHYHMRLLHDANLLRCEPIKSGTSDRTIFVLGFELTWDGCEFLDEIRNDSVWQRIRQTVAEKSGTLSFNVISKLAARSALECVEM